LPDSNPLVKIGVPESSRAVPNGSSAAAPITAVPSNAPLSEEMIWAQLRTVSDPEIPASIVDLGLVYAVKLTSLEGGRNRIEIDMTVTAPGCAMTESIKNEVESKLMRLPNAKDVRVNIVFDPPWHAGLISEQVRALLGL
jgi:metal-sulfur cluster biosynthetic enzyme